MGASKGKTPKISVTGTKGKTTTVTIIADVLQKLSHNVLKVDTTGHFLNGVRKSTLNDSTEIWGLVPSVCPGRYLYEFHISPELKENQVAVLECSLGCSNPPGLGYALHQVGIFLNVYEDHLGSTDRLNSVEDILEAKSFIFRRIRRDGWAVFNADDEMVVRGLSELPDFYKVNILPFGLNFKHFDINKHIEDGGSAVTIEEGWVVIINKNDKNKIIALSDLTWTFDGYFEPSVYNAMASIAGVYAYLKEDIPTNLRDVLASVKLDPYGGRLTLLDNKQGVKILADYAHEKVSLTKVAQLAHNLKNEGGQVIGVVRLAYDRTDDLIRDTGNSISTEFDKFIVYDKIDGYWRKPSQPGHSRKFVHQEVGRISELFNQAIKVKNPNTERILREDEAIARAAEIAKPGDVVVVIVNDDIKRSIGFIQKYFNAEFI